MTKAKTHQITIAADFEVKAKWVIIDEVPRLQRFRVYKDGKDVTAKLGKLNLLNQIEYELLRNP